jgi:hypothetical protein
MSTFRSRLARYGTINCEQVMPVPVIPICAVSCCLPRPICEYKAPQCYIPPRVPPVGCNPPASAIENAPSEAIIQPKGPLEIPNYNPYLPPPAVGSILTNTTGTTPSGYLLCDGSEVSRTTYSALFMAIGTYYGDGNGSTTFNLPNLSTDTPGCVVTYIIKT